MEGEITTLVPGGGRSLAESASTRSTHQPGGFGMDLAFAGMPPFDPVAMRSADLTGFYPDPSVLIENLTFRFAENRGIAYPKTHCL